MFIPQKKKNPYIDFLLKAVAEGAVNVSFEYELYLQFRHLFFAEHRNVANMHTFLSSLSFPHLFQQK